ncbi:hypothetical protein JW877_03275 [bacterium]|nr:hypothetical protein [bacterium]
MKNNSTRGYLIAAIIFLALALAQLVGMIRYIQQLPQDTFGLTLDIVIVVVEIICAIAFIFAWRKSFSKKKKESLPGIEDIK